MKYTVLHLGTSMKKVLSFISFSQKNEIRRSFPAELARILLLIKLLLKGFIEIFFFICLRFSRWLWRFLCPTVSLIFIVFVVPIYLKLLFLFLLLTCVLIVVNTSTSYHIHLISRCFLVAHRTVSVKLLMVNGSVRGISARLKNKGATLLMHVSLLVLGLDILRHLLKLVQIFWQRGTKISTVDNRSGVWNRIVNHDEIRIILLHQRSLLILGVFIWHRATSCVHGCGSCSRIVHEILHIL